MQKNDDVSGEGFLGIQHVASVYTGSVMSLYQKKKN